MYDLALWKYYYVIVYNNFKSGYNKCLRKLFGFGRRDSMTGIFICMRGLCCHAVSVCPSVRPSVAFVDDVKTNKHIFEIVSPSGSDTILVFPYQRGCRYSDGNPPNGGVECKGI